MAIQSLVDLGAKVFLVRRYAVVNNSNWSAFNPSIIKDDNGDYWIAFRSSNYTFTENRITVRLTTGNRVRNRIFLAKLNKDDYWSIDETTLVEVSTKNIKPDAIRGLEDPRLFVDEDSNYCISATYLEKDSPIARIAKIKIKSLEDPVVLSLDIYPSPRNQVEKNWMPVMWTNSFIYDYCSAIVDGELVEHDVNEKYKEFRGGTQVIPLGDGTGIGLIHEVYMVTVHGANPITFASTTNIRNYSHRFVRYDKNLKPIQCSDSFIFYREGIEFASGIAETEDGYVISFGRSDLASYVATISKEKALSLLKDLDV